MIVIKKRCVYLNMKCEILTMNVSHVRGIFPTFRIVL